MQPARQAPNVAHHHGAHLRFDRLLVVNGDPGGDALAAEVRHCRKEVREPAEASLEPIVRARDHLGVEPRARDDQEQVGVQDAVVGAIVMNVEPANVNRQILAVNREAQRGLADPGAGSQGSSRRCFRCPWE